MALVSLFFCALLFANFSMSSQYREEACERIRRPFHLQSNAELSLYVTGLQQLKANGKFQIFVQAHSHAHRIHFGSSFFFYHTYYVWEVETLCGLFLSE